MALQLLKLTTLNRTRKRAILIAYDFCAMVVALWAAFSTRLGMFYFPDEPLVLASAAASFVVGLFVLYRLQIYHIVLRYFDLRTVSRIFGGAAVAAAAWFVMINLTQERILVDGVPIMVPRSVGFIYCGFLFLLLFMGRYVMALALAKAARDPAPSPHKWVNVAIYGANAAGISLAESVLRTNQFVLRAFVDEDPAMCGQIISGVPIYAPETLPELVRSARITEVFLALPRATRTQRLAAIQRLRELDIKVKTIPAPEEIVSGRFTVSDIRPIDVGDLLRRDPIEPLNELIRDAAQGRSVLVTGAGGSIGSEICRQILHAQPERLVLLEHSEFALYTIAEELTDARRKLSGADTPALVTVVGSILNEKLVRRLITENQIDTIYHAAAYKHVPLLEENVVVGVENNVIGTLVLARAAHEAKLTRFTMISTDKAVRPKSVMGASKRVAELIVQAFADRSDCRTRFGIVRFGNVLDSSGSVVQRFRNQIRAGGPLTVTHEDMTRFFMSIPEATQLVLQASAMALDGEVFVLDMGEPVRISELARQMATLSGMTVRDRDNPHGDIAIEFVGLRPGEKLHEELFVGDATLETAHPRIKMAKERYLPFSEMDRLLDKLESAILKNDPAVVRERLHEFVVPDLGDQSAIRAEGLGSDHPPVSLVR